MDRFLKESCGASDFVLPKLVSCEVFYRRLQLALTMPYRTGTRVFLEIDLYLTDEPQNYAQVLGSINRGVDILVAPLAAGLEEWLRTSKGMSQSILDCSRLSAQEREERALELIEKAVAPHTTTLIGPVPFSENAAERFPLEGFTRSFLVQRPQMRAAFRALEGETGVHVWCSVRRSGKTVACGSFARFSDGAALALQTAIVTHAGPTQASAAEEAIFRDAVKEAIRQGTELPSDFVVRMAKLCANQESDSRRKIIFFLDEYEEFFGILNAGSKEDATLRHVVIPLLEQMTLFASDNLILFVGQQPDAYFVCPTRNPLSPQVRVNTFPLFAHEAGSSDSEFARLVAAATFGRLNPSAEGVDCLYQETAGHPYLTVALLQELFDWLIERQVSMRGFALNADMYGRFARECLNSQVMRKGGIRGGQRFRFFEGTIGGCLHADSKISIPWAYVTHRLLKVIASDGAADFGCSEKRFSELAKQVQKGGPEFDAATILRQATLANFLRLKEGRISVAIPILGRIARIAAPPLR